MYVNGVELDVLKREVDNGYSPTTATILDLIEKARGYRDAKRYVYLRDAKLHDPVWAAWVEFNDPDDMDRIVDEHIQATKINELTPIK